MDRPETPANKTHDNVGDHTNTKMMISDNSSIISDLEQNEKKQNIVNVLQVSDPQMPVPDGEQSTHHGTQRLTGSSNQGAFAKGSD